MVYFARTDPIASQPLSPFAASQPGIFPVDFMAIKSSSSSCIDPWQVVSAFAPYLRIAHHISGRVRLKLDPAALDAPALRELGSDRLEQALGTVRGVQDISVNLLARSCTVAYDASTIPDAAWPDLLAGRQTPAAAVLMGVLQEKYAEIRHGQL